MRNWILNTQYSIFFNIWLFLLKIWHFSVKFWWILIGISRQTEIYKICKPSHRSEFENLQISSFFVFLLKFSSHSANFPQNHCFSRWFWWNLVGILRKFHRNPADFENFKFRTISEISWILTDFRQTRARQEFRKLDKKSGLAWS